MFNFAILRVLVAAAFFTESIAYQFHFGYEDPAEYLLIKEEDITIPFTSTNAKKISVEQQYTATFKDSYMINAIHIFYNKTDNNLISEVKEYSGYGDSHANLTIFAKIGSDLPYKVKIWGYDLRFQGARLCSDFEEVYGDDAHCVLDT